MMELRRVDQITVEKLMADRHKYLTFDTRTPAEFSEATIPGSINLPIFSDDERAIVGTIYHDNGQKEAFEKGLEIVGPKIQSLIDRFKEAMDGESRIPVIFCWRGGMRSHGVVTILENAGFKTFQLQDGHKAYRRHVIDSLADYSLFPGLIVLHGLTGAGKTDLLHELSQRGASVFDLEGLAQHRSSVLGEINLKPRGQIMFEALFLDRLNELDACHHIFVEGESRKVGKVVIPEFFFDAMGRGKNVKVECSDDSRISRLVEEYCHVPDEELEKLKGKMPFFAKSLGKKKAEKLKEMLDRKDFTSCAALLLIEYYDVLYRHTVDKMEYSFHVDSEDIQKAAGILIDKFGKGC